MTTEKLIEIAGAALCDTLCEGCEIEVEGVGSCFECRVQAAKEIADRLREHNAIVLGKKYPVKDYTASMTKNEDMEDVFSINKSERALVQKRGIQGML